MKLNEYQEAAKTTAVYPAQGNNLAYPVLGLAGEAGEVANDTKKVYRDDDGKLTPARREGLVKELGDVLWYVSTVATELGVSLEKVAALNLDKLKRRKEENTIKGSGSNR